MFPVLHTFPILPPSRTPDDRLAGHQYRQLGVHGAIVPFRLSLPGPADGLQTATPDQASLHVCAVRWMGLPIHCGPHVKGGYQCGRHVVLLHNAYGQACTPSDIYPCTPCLLIHAQHGPARGGAPLTVTSSASHSYIVAPLLIPFTLFLLLFESSSPLDNTFTSPRCSLLQAQRAKHIKCDATLLSSRLPLLLPHSSPRPQYLHLRLASLLLSQIPHG